MPPGPLLPIHPPLLTRLVQQLAHADGVRLGRCTSAAPDVTTLNPPSRSTLDPVHPNPSQPCWYLPTPHTPSHLPCLTRLVKQLTHAGHVDLLEPAGGFEAGEALEVGGVVPLSRAGRGRNQDGRAAWLCRPLGLVAAATAAEPCARGLGPASRQEPLPGQCKALRPSATLLGSHLIGSRSSSPSLRATR